MSYETGGWVEKGRNRGCLTLLLLLFLLIIIIFYFFFFFFFFFIFVFFSFFLSILSILLTFDTSFITTSWFPFSLQG